MVKSRDWYAPRRTKVWGQLANIDSYNNIDCLVQVDDLALVVNDRHGTDTELGEHVHDVKHCCLKSGCGNGSEWLLRSGFVDICADSELLNTCSEVLRYVAALMSDVSGVGVYSRSWR